MPGNIRYQFAFVLAAIGGGLCVYGIVKWRELPHYSASGIATSIELNLSLDLARLGRDNPPPAEQIDVMRKGVRTEIVAEIALEHARARSWITAGVVLLAMALAQSLMQRWWRARGRVP